MSLKTGETTYNLIKELDYMKKGQFEKAKVLLLREPKMQHARKALKLRQMIQKSEIEAAASIKALGLLDDEGAAPGLKAGEQLPPVEDIAEMWEKDASQVVEQVELQLTQSSIDLYEFADTFWKMAIMKPTICLLDGEEPMKEGFMEKMDLEDFLGVPIWYCSFFVTLSVSQRKNLSKEQQESA